MKALKTLVAGMSLLLAAGLGLLAYGISAKGPSGKGGTPTAQFGSVELPMPAGARVEQMVAAGDRVVLRIAGAGPERLLVIDPAAGRLAGSFVLAPEAPAR